MSESIPDIDKHVKDQDWRWVDVDSDTGEVIVFEAPLQSAGSFIDSIETFKSLPTLIEHEEKKAARRRASNPLFQRVKLNQETQTKMDGKKTSEGKDEDSDSSSGETCSLSSASETYSFPTDDGFYFDKVKLLPLIEAESSSKGGEASAPIFEVEVEVITPTINHLGGVGRVEDVEKIEEKTEEGSTTELEDEDEHTEKVSLLEFLRRDEPTLAAVCTIFLFGSMWALEQGRGPASVFMRRM
jgi:hypothetical protein